MKTRGPQHGSMVLLMICAVLLVSALASHPAHGKEGRTWAVVVGIDEYLKDVTPLNCAVNDAESFTRTLTEKAGVSENTVFLLTTKSKSGNRVPDKSNILRWVTYVKTNARPEDTFFFFFSGHGMDMDKETFLLTYEADPQSKETLETSSLKVSDLRKLIMEMPVPRVLLFVDACRNDPRSGKGEKDNKMTGVQAKSLIIGGRNQMAKNDSGSGFSLTFFSCKVGERSYEWTEQGMGFFTYHLIKGMNGAASNDNGNVTLGSIRGYIAKSVPQALQKERGSLLQNPWVKGDESADADEWILCRGAGAPGTPRNQVPVATPATGAQAPDREDSLDPYPQAPDRAQAGSHRDHGDDYMMRKKIDKAIGEYREALRWDPDYLAVYESLGEAYARAGDFDSAVTTYSKALAKNPRGTEYYVKRAAAYGKKGDFEKALIDLDRALTLSPRSTMTLFQKGSVFESMKRKSEALAAYKKCLEVAPPSDEGIRQKAKEKILQLGGTP
jgi:hypothetical protein